MISNQQQQQHQHQPTNNNNNNNNNLDLSNNSLLLASSGSNSSDELSFTAFIDLCRFCSVKIGSRLNLFEKEAEQRQLLFKIRTILPISVSFNVKFNADIVTFLM